MQCRRAELSIGGPAASALCDDAGAWVENRHTEAVRGVAAVDGASLSYSPAWDQAGRDRRQDAFVWLFLSYVLQSIGELLIMPIGYAMIGKLAPKQYQGVMMGSWMLVTGLASLFAGDFSGMIPEPTGTTAVATNPGYAKLFAELGAGSLAVGIALVVLIPFLRKLITDKAETRPIEAATVVPVA